MQIKGAIFNIYKPNFYDILWKNFFYISCSIRLNRYLYFKIKLIIDILVYNHSFFSIIIIAYDSVYLILLIIYNDATFIKNQY